MGNLVTLTIDGKTVSVPTGTLVVDAAKKSGIDIPVFCYHPKMEPVGMCRLCLVEIGRPLVDRSTGQPVMDADGKPRIQYSPKLETACTTPVSEGMAVVTQSAKVVAARKEMLEFILTSHPLDCPICDKGGECPLQNLTMQYGPGQSRYLYDEKIHLAKHVPLGELIFLDRERCIQCARCVRFQTEIVDDPVLGLTQRGRSLEIITNSEPGFDSIWSGNTTDICPVGALTTADFRFGARPWEMKSAASLCNHCPVGCNTTVNVRREASTNGMQVIKRIMPRQNEAVNEIWICDKGRFAYQYTESPERLKEPLVRKGGQLVPASWDEALERVAAEIKKAGTGMVSLASGRLANEDLFNLAKLTAQQGGQALLYSYMAGGDLTGKLGLPEGSNFGTMGKETAIVVVASDLHEEAPVWWLRIKQAAKRGATLIVVNARATRLDGYASHVVRYTYGNESKAAAELIPGQTVSEAARKAAEAFAAAENAVILFGSDGLGLEASAELARTCAEALVVSGHYGRANNGLVGVWPNGNTQGAWDLGFHAAVGAGLASALTGATLVYVAAADPAGDDPALVKVLEQAGFVVVNELFLSETAKLADVVLPVHAYTEREGTYTSGERRVQRFFPVVPALPGTRPDFAIFTQLGEKLSTGLEGRAASLTFLKLAAETAGYASLTYQSLAAVAEQWPIVGGHDLYFGGTSYENNQGLGVQLPGRVTSGAAVQLPDKMIVHTQPVRAGAVRLLPVTCLFDRGSLMQPAKLLQQRLAPVGIWVHPELAARNGLSDGQTIEVEINGVKAALVVKFDEHVPQDVALVPRSVSLPVSEAGWLAFTPQPVAGD